MLLPSKFKNITVVLKDKEQWEKLKVLLTPYGITWRNGSPLHKEKFPEFPYQFHIEDTASMSSIDYSYKKYELRSIIIEELLQEL